MSVKSADNAVEQFVAILKSGDIIGKQNDLRQLIKGPLALAREKGTILETDAAQAVLSRIDPEYKSDLVRDVVQSFEEEVERGNILLDEIEAGLVELQTLLETILQRLQNENRKQQLDPIKLAALMSSYEDARCILIYLKLRTGALRLTLGIPFEEQNPKISDAFADTIEEGDFLLRVGKLETICMMNRS